MSLGADSSPVSFSYFQHFIYLSVSASAVFVNWSVVPINASFVALQPSPICYLHVHVVLICKPLREHSPRPFWVCEFDVKVMQQLCNELVHLNLTMLLVLSHKVNVETYQSNVAANASPRAAASERHVMSVVEAYLLGITKPARGVERISIVTCESFRESHNTLVLCQTYPKQPCRGSQQLGSFRHMCREEQSCRRPQGLQERTEEAGTQSMAASVWPLVCMRRKAGGPASAGK